MKQGRLVSGETTLVRMWVLAAVAAVLGLVGGGAAVLLFKLISLMTHLTLLGDVGFDLPTLRGYHPTLWLIPITVGGGLLVSLIATWSPVIRGHGIPESLEAILNRDSKIRPRAAVAKPLSAAITIGTGGPFGAEGPIIVTGGSIGSLIGQLLSVSAAERKIMLATGAAAGMSGTFNTPVAAVILAIELVLFERSLRVIVPLSIASGIAAAIHVVAFGTDPLFAIHTALRVSLVHLPLFVVVGLASGLMAIVLNKGLFTMEAAFRKLPVKIFWWPAIGALGFALIGLAVPRTLSMGYSAIVDTLNGHFATVALAVLLIAKLASWLIALGSQTSGGTLAPMFLVGATMGALLGNAVNAILPAWHVSPAAFALVAMGATFGAATKALFAAVVFAAEVTGEYTMIVPLLIGAAVAELVVEGVLSDRLMTEKLSHRGFRVEFRTAVDTLRMRVARQVMRDAMVVRSDASADTARREMAARGFAEIAVVDARGDFVGVVTEAALPPVGGHGGVPAQDGSTTLGTAAGIAQFVDRTIAPIDAEDYLAAALERLLQYRIEALPVVDGSLVVGTLSRDDIMAERLRRGTAQEVRQSGWFASRSWTWRRRRGQGAAQLGVPSDLAGKIVIPAPLRPGGNGSDRARGAARPVEPATGRRVTVDHRAAALRPNRPAHDRLLPDPVQLTAGLGQFQLSEKSRIVLAWGSAAARPLAETLASQLRPAIGFRIRVSDGRAYRDDICLRLGPVDGLPADHAAEGYVLTVGMTGVTVAAPTLAGLHHGVQTVRQLLPVWASAPFVAPGPWTMPAVTIVDYPRLDHRGVALDVSQALPSPATVCRIIDRIAAYKVNALRLALSPAQAERLAAAGVPAGAPQAWVSAHDAPSMRPGGYWTALEYRDIEAYAAARFVTVTTALADDDVVTLDSATILSNSGSVDATFAVMGRRGSGIESVAVVGAGDDADHLAATVFPGALAAAEFGWSPRVSAADRATATGDFLARVAAQGPRLALQDMPFRAVSTVPWRLHMATVPLRVHRRTVAGPIAILVAPGLAGDAVVASVDWGDGSVSDARVTADFGMHGPRGDARGEVHRFLVIAEHHYVRPGSYRVAITASAPDAAPARTSVMVRAVGAPVLARRRHLRTAAASARAGQDGAPAAGVQAGSDPSASVDSPAG